MPVRRESRTRAEAKRACEFIKKKDPILVSIFLRQVSKELLPIIKKHKERLEKVILDLDETIESVE